MSADKPSAIIFGALLPHVIFFCIANLCAPPQCTALHFHFSILRLPSYARDGIKWVVCAWTWFSPLYGCACTGRRPQHLVAEPCALPRPAQWRGTRLGMFASPYACYGSADALH